MRGTRVVVLTLAVLTPIVAMLAVIAVTNASATNEAQRAARLQPLGASQLQSLPAGKEALIEGRISARTPTHFRTFVAYLREQHVLDADLSDRWVPAGRYAPPLWIDLPNGQAQVTNNSYQLANPPATWLEPGTPTSNPMRYSGFEVGSRVVVIGIAVRGDGGTAIQAHVVSGGTRADYLAAQGGAAALPTLAGILAIALAAFGLILAYFTLRQTRTTPVE